MSETPLPGAPYPGGCVTFAIPSGMQLENTLARNLVRVVDVARNVPVVLGFRPYEIHLVTTRWTGGVRGSGAEIVISDDILTPIPKLMSLDGLTELVTSGGLNEQGLVQVIEISGRYTEQYLRGWDASGNPQPKDQQFYWEVLFPSLDKSQPYGVRRRFEMGLAPTYEADNVQWRVTLTRAWPDRNPDGSPS